MVIILLAIKKGIHMKKTNIGMVFGFLFILTFFSATPVFAEEEQVVADADTYIIENYPSANYGFAQFLNVVASDYIAQADAYFHFNITNKPENWNKAEIRISGQSSPVPYYISVYLITAVWDEYTLTWNNRPSVGAHIVDITIPPLSIQFDVSNYVQGNGISVCLKARDAAQLGILVLYSREWSSSPPVLIWTYTPNSTDTINGYKIALILLGVIGSVLIINRRKVIKK